MKYLFSGRLNSKDYLKDIFKFENIGVLHESSFSKDDPDEIEKIKRALPLFLLLRRKKSTMQYQLLKR